MHAQIKKSPPTAPRPARRPAHTITNREIQEALKHGDKHVQENGRIQHRHPMYSAGGHQAHRLVVITEADGTLVVTQFDRDNDL
jgi:hypothetical protein